MGVSAVVPILITDGRERRSARRFAVHFRVHWGHGQYAEFPGEVTDLGAGGCFVESKEEVREGELVKLHILTPGHGALTVWGRVAFRAKGTGFGVHFTTFSRGSARDKLATILSEEAGRS